MYCNSADHFGERNQYLLCALFNKILPFLRPGNTSTFLGNIIDMLIKSIISVIFHV